MAERLFPLSDFERTIADAVRDDLDSRSSRSSSGNHVYLYGALHDSAADRLVLALTLTDDPELEINRDLESWILSGCRYTDDGKPLLMSVVLYLSGDCPMTAPPEQVVRDALAVMRKYRQCVRVMSRGRSAMPGSIIVIQRNSSGQSRVDAVSVLEGQEQRQN